MTEADTSRVAVERLVNGLNREAELLTGLKDASLEAKTFLALLARAEKAEAERDDADSTAQDKETSADYWHEESRIQYARAENAEAERDAAWNAALDAAITAMPEGSGLDEVLIAFKKGTDQ